MRDAPGLGRAFFEVRIRSGFGRVAATNDSPRQTVNHKAIKRESFDSGFQSEASSPLCLSGTLAGRRSFWHEARVRMWPIPDIGRARFRAVQYGAKR
ncbi:hypothetical protein BOSE62_30573 [Bosea sp. 62]|nr:hypothetical protein BOSE46_130004 [Bosea sp. 46]CAD5265475.1 hypothetical protein BOSE21B_111032 [Bosea sp. 21B]VXB75796.1 hypothetical protein BOSE29B_120161 [Bosea sp. 29B]VXC13932.1 hypothetical protein BOSE125_180013 [Bosea sp. 125]VXC26402.1 hypothetical protein BOSE62_30573 [Bosea sp. 62]VXC74387.1 hypothetical protein BOSE127_40360 [Bosea sp. 127]